MSKIMTVKVRFSGNTSVRRQGSSGFDVGVITKSEAKEYVYLWDGPAPEKGSLAVVKVAKEYHVVTVTGWEPGRASNATKHLVSLLDVVGYEARVAADDERSRLLNELRLRQSKMDEQERYARLAETDPEARAMLDRLMELG